MSSLFNTVSGAEDGACGAGAGVEVGNEVGDGVGNEVGDGVGVGVCGDNGSAEVPGAASEAKDLGEA